MSLWCWWVTPGRSLHSCRIGAGHQKELRGLFLEAWDFGQAWPEGRWRWSVAIRSCGQWFNRQRLNGEASVKTSDAKAQWRRFLIGEHTDVSRWQPALIPQTGCGSCVFVFVWLVLLIGILYNKTNCKRSAFPISVSRSSEFLNLRGSWERSHFLTSKPEVGVDCTGSWHLKWGPSRRGLSP